MDFYYTSDFENVITQLCKKKKDGYSSCIDDIKTELSNLTVDQLWNLPTNIYNDHPLRIVKTRIPNSLLNLGKSKAFRLIYIINMDKNYTVFMFIYPKRGKHSKDKITENELMRFLVNFKTELQNNELKKFELELEPALSEVKVNLN